MKKLELGISERIDFADSEFKSCYLDRINDNLIVYLNSWDDNLIKIVFLNTLHFSFKWGDIVNGLYQIDKDEFYRESIACYGEIPKSLEFSRFSIIDIQDSEFFKVVAEDVVVTKELIHHDGNGL